MTTRRVLGQAEWAEGSSTRRSVVVAIYTLAFFGVLPAWLWKLGERTDALAALPPVHGLRTFGALVAAAGATLTASCMARLSLIGRGLPISHLPPRNLVTNGAYATMRHPIYVGYTLAFVGTGLAAGSLGIAAVSGTLLTLGWLIYALGFEEPRLLRRHGPAFGDYVARVPVLPGMRALAAGARRVWAVARPCAQGLANWPVVWRMGDTIWATFGLFCAVGSALAVAVFTTTLAPTLGERRAALFAVGASTSTLLGCWLVARLYKWSLLRRNPSEAMRQVGFVSWGGYGGAIGFVLAFAHATRTSSLLLLDAVFTASLLCSCLGRFGCASYGCCYGRPATGGVVWDRPESKVVRERGVEGAVARVPTQLLSALHVLVLFVMVMPMCSRLAPGAATALVFLGYGVGRFGIEVLRDEPRFSRVALTRGQFAALGVIVASQLLLFSLSAAGPRVVPAMGWPSMLHLAVALGCGLLTFVVCGLHVRTVGRW